MNYNVSICAICHGPMNFTQIRESVYWLPDLDRNDYMWAQYEGFQHRFAHRACWKGLKEKRRRKIRNRSFTGQEPRSMGQRV